MRRPTILRCACCYSRCRNIAEQLWRGGEAVDLRVGEKVRVAVGACKGATLQDPTDI
jgi:hypothetical protein